MGSWGGVICDGAPARSSFLPREVPELLGAVSLDQSAGLLGQFVIQMDPAERVDAREFARDAQPVGDPQGLYSLFHVVVDLSVLGRGDRPLREEQLGLGVCGTAEVLSDDFAQT